MACERCGAPIAMDSLRVMPTLSAPNGEKVFLEIRLLATHDALRTKGAMFCESCWGVFLEMIGPIGEAIRIKGVQAPPARRLD